jgi:hypothetical protein
MNMTNLEYLKAILKQQRLTDAEFNALKEKRKEVGHFLASKLSGFKASVRWAGSWAKDTMIQENYDADIAVYFDSEENGAGSTLEAIYATVQAWLAEEYVVELKTSAIRLRNTEDKGYTHVDVVPGRFFNADREDTWLHRTSGDKVRFKTNLDVHVATIRDSGLKPLVRLMKLWARRNGIDCKTFVLELLCVKLGADVSTETLDAQVIHVLEQFRDKSDSLCIEDPANPNGNDLSGALDAARSLLEAFAVMSLAYIDADDWSAVFGPVEDDEDKGENTKRAALQSVTIHVKPSAQPWCCSESRDVH